MVSFRKDVWGNKSADVEFKDNIELVIVGAPSSASGGFRQESEDRSAGVLFS